MLDGVVVVEFDATIVTEASRISRWLIAWRIVSARFGALENFRFRIERVLADTEPLRDLRDGIAPPGDLRDCSALEIVT